MLKMFHQIRTTGDGGAGESAPGGSVAFWERTWRQGDYTESARFCATDPLRSLLEHHAVPGSVMLEGGCGRGAYVAHHAARGVEAVGLDFATTTLADVRHRYPALLLGAADVSKLPLRDASVATYYSGGVVEHFEAGPFEAIAEARRVLGPGGVFLVSVPYFSPLRRTLAPFRRRHWSRAQAHTVGAAPPHWEFFQYAYTPQEFGRILSGQGFVVLSRKGYSILWGLYELPLLGRLLERAAHRPPDTVTTAARAGGDGGGGAGGGPEDKTAASGTSLLKRLVVSEDDTVPVVGRLVRLLRALAANMMMYECAVAGAGRS